MISRAIAFLLAMLTGGIRPKASMDFERWTADNETSRQHRYTAYSRVLLWGADHPVLFTGALALLSILVAVLVQHPPWDSLRVLSRMPRQGTLDVAAYIGVPWTVQATIVALVYPIVLSFVALLLQRRSRSAVAMRVYLLESAILPAGASAVGLLIAMGLQYFLVPASPEIFRDWLPLLLVGNGFWFVVNLLLAGHFVSSTVRFLDSDVQNAAYTRLAVDSVLKRELVEAIARRRLRILAHDWGVAEVEDGRPLAPLVKSTSITLGQPQVVRRSHALIELHDVHTNILWGGVMLWRWRHSWPSKTRVERPQLLLPLPLGARMSGSIVLCGVEGGATLSSLEKLLIRGSFSLGKVGRGRSTLTCREMLEELGAEVERCAELGQFAAAQDALNLAIDLHATLLKASAIGVQGEDLSVALYVASPHGWSTFSADWTNHYRGLVRLAVNYMDRDVRLLYALSAAPRKIVTRLGPRPPQVLLDLLKIHHFISIELFSWWRRKAQAHVATGALEFNGVLPLPLNKVYEAGLAAFVGGDHRFRVNIPNDGADGHLWAIHTSNALLFAERIDARAVDVLQAVDQSDEYGAVWLTDSLLKWRETQENSRAVVNGRVVETPDVSLSVASLNWTKAKETIWQGGDRPTLEVAKAALNRAIYNYWRTVRLFLALRLILAVEASPKLTSLPLRMAVTLITGRHLKDGSGGKVVSLADFDAVLYLVLRNQFSLNSDRERLEKIDETKGSPRGEPAVAGRVYAIPRITPQFDSMRVPLARLLTAVSSPGPSPLRQCEQFMYDHWNDLPRLRQVSAFISDVRTRLLSKESRATRGDVEGLVHLIGRPPSITRRMLSASSALKKLARRADYEHLMTLRSRPLNVDAINQVALNVSVRVIETLPFRLPAEVQIRMVPSVSGDAAKIVVDCEKEQFTVGGETAFSAATADAEASFIQEDIMIFAIRKLLVGILPVNTPAMHEQVDSDSEEPRRFVRAVAHEIEKLRATGADPIVLSGGLSWHLNPQMWGEAEFQYKPVVGISITVAEEPLVWPPDRIKDQALPVVSCVNDAAVYDLNTPNDDCYVIDRALIRYLHIEGQDAMPAVKVLWQQIGDGRLKIQQEWRLGFSSKAS